jgi:hypothetical protein
VALALAVVAAALTTSAFLLYIRGVVTMKMSNVHERMIAAPAACVGALLDTLASADDRFWPHENWPGVKFDLPLQVGPPGDTAPVPTRCRPILRVGTSDLRLLIARGPSLSQGSRGPRVRIRLPPAASLFSAVNPETVAEKSRPAPQPQYRRGGICGHAQHLPAIEASADADEHPGGIQCLSSS